MRVQVTGGRQPRDHYYCYNARNQLEFVRSGPDCNGSPAVVALGYDAQGNLAFKNGSTYGFDDGNRLRSAAGQGYRYDAQGRRVRSDVGGAQRRYSFYAQDGRLLWQRDEVAGTRSVNVYLSGSLVAEYRRPLSGATASVGFLHTDPLGSPIAKTDATGAVIERSEYEPYGLLLNRANDDRPGYTGHVVDSATGLTYMQQRYYDPNIGRFLSVDPVAAYTDKGILFNRYWYANGNPYRFTDPDGRLSYETELRGQKLPVHIDDSLPMKEQKQLQAKVDAGIAKLNDAKLSKQESAVIQNVKSLDVSGSANRSFIRESTGALTLTDDFVKQSSSAWLGSSVAHDGMHGELFKAGGISLSRGLPAEVGAMKFQLRVGEKMGLSNTEKGYLQNLISNPELLKSYINSSP
jgi:RHS repeat-associated protein